jgi:ribosomal protein S20
MEATSSAISKEAKQTIIEACSILFNSKFKIVKEEMRITEGNAFLKMSKKDFDKMAQRQIEADSETMKTSLHALYKSIDKSDFSKFIEEAKNYTNEQFLKDIEDVFGIDNANFLQTEIKRLEYANNR